MRVRSGHLLMIVVVGAVALLLAPAASAARVSVAQGPEASLRYGDIVRVAPRTLMIVGRALDVARGQADVGNAILYRSGETLYMIDTGSTASFRPFLRRAIQRLRPF
jgi:hypothetical protein